mgnify:CR=1 FL=1
MSQRVFHVPDSLNGQTLVAALRAWQPEFSWGQAKELLTTRRVSVNGAICVDHGRRIKSGDVVHLFETPRTPDQVLAIVAPFLTPATTPGMPNTGGGFAAFTGGYSGALRRNRQRSDRPKQHGPYRLPQQSDEVDSRAHDVFAPEVE